MADQHLKTEEIKQPGTYGTPYGGMPWGGYPGAGSQMYGGGCAGCPGYHHYWPHHTMSQPWWGHHHGWGHHYGWGHHIPWYPHGPHWGGYPAGPGWNREDE